MTYKGVQWASGAVGRHAIRGIAQRDDLELVGLYVSNLDKHGIDAGELAGISPLGVAASNDIDALLALRPDCIHYSPLYPDLNLLQHPMANNQTTAATIGKQLKHQQQPNNQK